MALSESESVAYGGLKTGSLVRAPQSPHYEELTPDRSISSLNKQNSIFSLTLEEIQLKSGKTFGSMNMDEFLANLWNVEENQVPSQLNQNKPIDDKAIGSQPTLARQGSFSIPTPLCKKTVDEVWFEIQKDLPQQQEANDIVDHEPPQRQQTFGEMTLEDFLIKAGVVQELSGSSQQKKVNPAQTNGTSLDVNYGTGHLMIGSSQQNMLTVPIQNNNASLDTNFGMAHMMGLGFPSHQIVANNMAAGNGYAAAYPIFTQKTIMGEPSNVSGKQNGTNSLLDPAVPQNKKRIIEGPPEVVVERRQRRLIKNRESAARSRARKQAYTVELELELNQLKQENAKLKQLVEENEQRRKQEVLKRKQSMPAQRKVVDKMRTIRRTVSFGW